MTRIFGIICFIMLLHKPGDSFAQDTLPNITVKNINGRIVVSWMNGYKETVTNIHIQRSYDSLKNYTSIGSVLNPMNRENGYADVNPPYNKMYYRLSITFEGGNYVISKPARPVKEIPIQTEEEKEQTLRFRYPWQVSVIPPSNKSDIQLPMSDSIRIAPPVVNVPGLPPVNRTEPGYPSLRIFTAKEQQVVIYLPDAASKKYRAKFYDEQNKFLFELTKLTEPYLILEKVNFGKTGWYYFELYNGETLVEKNKILIGKDGKNGEGRKSGNR